MARAQANWYTLGRFWRAAAISLSVRLIMFHALVISALIMALETSCLTAWELQQLETFQVKKLRIMMAGAAVRQTNTWVR
eukprot:12055370-Heterocapsa_arctica.AAC.1